MMRLENWENWLERCIVIEPQKLAEVRGSDLRAPWVNQDIRDLMTSDRNNVNGQTLASLIDGYRDQWWSDGEHMWQVKVLGKENKVLHYCLINETGDSFGLRQPEDEPL
jgi:hypothetical protein